MNSPVDTGMVIDLKKRYAGGVLEHKEMGYWRPGYEPKAIDAICLTRITPQEGVGAEEATAAVAGESSTARSPASLPSASGWTSSVPAAQRDDAAVGIARFGQSAPGPVLMKHFGITADAVVAAVRASVTDDALVD